MKDSNPEGLLVGLIVFLAVAGALIVCAFALLLTANITAAKLKKTKSEDENK